MTEKLRETCAECGRDHSPDVGCAYPFGERSADRRPDNDTMLGWFANAIETGVVVAERERLRAALAAPSVVRDRIVDLVWKARELDDPNAVVDDLLDAAVEAIERVLQPRGRCTECGAGETYWRHGPGDPLTGLHAFQPPRPEAQEMSDGNE